MSTIKSSDEHLTLNADGSSKDIKFQANGVEKASISSSGAFTSTTIDATKLTGTIPNFTSTGIDDNADATAITIDSSERVGIGSTSPLAKLDISGNTDTWTGMSKIFLTDTSTNSGSRNWSIGNGGTGYGDLSIINSNAKGGVPADSTGTVAQIIDNSGASFFGTSSSSSDAWNVNSGSFVQLASDFPLSATNNGTVAIFNRNSSTGTIVEFKQGTGTAVGTISVTGSATAYNTSSDYRLKENVDYTWDATTRLKQLKPARFNFIADDTNTLVDGFIAHEVSSVVPEAVSGEKDAMTEEVLYKEGDELPEGKSVGDVKTAAAINPQGIDQSKLVPLLVKTIQELEARIAALEA